jgi:mannitol/fructose-specific phosphotransferase system IIA component (Ntr-type)
MAVKISKFLKLENINLNLVQTQRTEAIHEVAEMLIQHPDMKNFNLFYEELLAREQIESTCIGYDVAFPHARTDHVKNMILAVGRNSKGVLFENMNQTVKLIFIIGTPKKMASDYLTLVGALARLLKNNDFRNQLLATDSPDEFLSLFSQAEQKLEAGK